MQLLGIYLYKQTPRAVRKVLKPDWYPFGDYRKPATGKPVRFSDSYMQTAAYQVYQRERLPEITVNCIVGMNGAGKSTLLDILYMTINNMAVRLLGKKAQMTGRNLSYARGLYADFFFICENKQYRITCRDIQTKLYILDTKTGTFRLYSISNHSDANSVLSKLFYTISTNYSLYAFNQSEYFLEEDELLQPDEKHIDEINGEWISGLFHKNDGYCTPIVITPYRESGNISVQKENRLASQRIMALSLLQKAQGVSFIDRYDPTMVSYELDKDYKSRTEKNYQQTIFDRYEGLDIRHVILSLETAWEQLILSEHDNERVDDEYTALYEMALFYMAYKTVKICLTYEDFGNTFGVKQLVKASKRLDKFNAYVNKTIPSKAKDVINKILRERLDDENGDLNHITLKLSVCKDYIDSLYDKNPIWYYYGEMHVNALIAGKRIRTYNDAVQQLPPAFFKCNMSFSQKDDVHRVSDSSYGFTLKDHFSLGKMSSGERQMLYSLSYVLYHIKNIQSVREDDNRVAYHNVCLIFDEAELYFHPDYQRRFLGMLLEGLSWCNIDIQKIHSIQILIVTHSPFVLTDILTQNSLYLKEGKRVNVKEQTFGANYYQMLNKSFFFDKKAIGEVSGKAIGEWIDKANNHEMVTEDQIKLVGDNLIQNYLLSHVQD